MTRCTVLTLALLIAGCASSSYVLTGNKRAPITPAAVRIYAQLPAKYEEIAFIEASSKGTFAIGEQGKTDAMIQALKEQAAALGANGIILEGMGTDSGASATTLTRVAPGTYSGAAIPVRHKAGQARAIFVQE